MVDLKLDEWEDLVALKQRADAVRNTSSMVGFRSAVDGLLRGTAKLRQSGGSDVPTAEGNVEAYRLWWGDDPDNAGKQLVMVDLLTAAAEAIDPGGDDYLVQLREDMLSRAEEVRDAHRRFQPSAQAG